MDTRRFSMEIDALQRDSQNAAPTILNGIKLYQQALISQTVTEDLTKVEPGFNLILSSFVVE